MGFMDSIGRIGSKSYITSHSLDSDGFGPIFGSQSSSGVPVNNDTALKIGSFWFCLRLISETIGYLPLQLKEPEKKGGYKKAEKHELYDTLRYNPDENTTSSLFWETGVMNMMLSGDLVAFKYLNEAGKTRLTLIPPQNVNIRYDVNLNKVAYDVTINGKMTTYFKGDHRNGGIKIFHVPGFGYDGIKGKNIVQNFKDTLGLNKAASDYGANWFSQGVTAGTVYSMDGDPGSEALEEYRKVVRELGTGAKNNGVPIVIPPGVIMEKTNALTPEQLSWIDIVKFSITDIANIFKIPHSFLLEVSSGTYSNVESNWKQLVLQTLMPYVRKIEDQIRLDILEEKDKKKGLKAEFNVNALIRPDYATLCTGLQKMVNEGVYSPDEVRDYLGDGPQEGNAGKIYMSNGNKRNIEALANATIPNQLLPNGGENNNNGTPV